MARGFGDGDRRGTLIGGPTVARRRTGPACRGGAGLNTVGRRLLLVGPLAAFMAGGVGFWAILSRMQRGTFDPRGVPTILLGKQVPRFTLPGFSSDDVRSAGHPILINFFASWCVPCVVEAPLLMRLRQRGIAVWGIAYKDKPDATAAFLSRSGDPYVRMASDLPGQAAIEFGVYGVPETYLIDRDGFVRWRWAGPLVEGVVAEQLDPLLKELA